MSRFKRQIVMFAAPLFAALAFTSLCAQQVPQPKSAAEIVGTPAASRPRDLNRKLTA